MNSATVQSRSVYDIEVSFRTELSDGYGRPYPCIKSEIIDASHINSWLENWYKTDPHLRRFFVHPDGRILKYDRKCREEEYPPALRFIEMDGCSTEDIVKNGSCESISTEVYVNWLRALEEDKSADIDYYGSKSRYGFDGWRKRGKYQGNGVYYYPPDEDIVWLIELVKIIWESGEGFIRPDEKCFSSEDRSLDYKGKKLHFVRHLGCVAVFTER